MSLITGTITDAYTGYPVENATVVLGGESDLTDQDGNYALTANTGQYTLKVIHRYYQRFIYNINLTENIQFNIPLQRLR